MFKILAILFFSLQGYAALNAPKIKILNFNIMCDFCTKATYDPFEIRIGYIQNTIERYSPDLVGFQEIRTESQVQKIFQNLAGFNQVFAKFWWGGYPDALIAYNNNRFEKLDSGYFWLGPSKGFSFGWEISIPRLAVWVKLKDKITKKEFIFASSHFDNRVENLNQSGIKLRVNLDKFNLPIIFAADTNLPRSYIGYKNLIDKKFVNSFDIKKNFSVNSNFQYGKKDMCYTKKGKKFPACSVEHVLLSKEDPWQVYSWQLDIFQYGPNKSFASDHRAVFVELAL